MSDDDYKGPPFDDYPEAFQKMVYQVSMRTGIPPMDLVKHVHKTSIAAVTEHMRRKKLAQERERQRRQHRKKKDECRPKEK
jgi:hypothetical protein